MQVISELRGARALFLALAMLWAGPEVMAQGVEPGMRKAFLAKFPNATVESIARTPFPGLYEVVFDGQLAYTDEKLNFVFFGNLYDLRGRTERNLTQERSAQLAAQTLRKSTDHAIKRVRGNGARVIYSFEDPNCGYCRQQQKEFAKLNDVTIYTFLWAILSPDSIEKARTIWCAKDRAKAWEDLMLRGVPPAGESKCDTPLDKNMALARRFGAQGTPAIFLADGRTVGGYVPAEKLEEAFKSVVSK